MGSNVRYTCENPDCPTAGTRYDLPRDTSSDCPTCGWSMFGHWAEGGDPELTPA